MVLIMLRLLALASIRFFIDIQVWVLSKKLVFQLSLNSRDSYSDFSRAQRLYPITIFAEALYLYSDSTAPLKLDKILKEDQTAKVVAHKVLRPQRETQKLRVRGVSRAQWISFVSEPRAINLIMEAVGKDNVNFS